MTPLNVESQLQLTQRLSSEKASNNVSVKSLPSVCRYCQFYTSQGRSSGYCQQLGVPVRGTMPSCSLALSPFAPS